MRSFGAIRLDAHGSGSHSVRKAAQKGREQMCMSCGCGEPYTTHGDKRNIVNADLKKAADASQISLKDVVRNIEKKLRTKTLARPSVDDDREP